MSFLIGVRCNSQEKCFNFLHGLNYTYVVLFVPILSLEKDYKLNAVKVLGGARRMEIIFVHFSTVRARALVGPLDFERGRRFRGHEEASRHRRRNRHLVQLRNLHS